MHKHRSHYHIPSPHQIGMQGIPTRLTDEQQPFAEPIGLTGMSTHGTCLAGVVSIDLDRHTALQARFVGNHRLQFGKRPPGGDRIGLALLDGDALKALTVFLPSMRPPFGALTNVG